MDIKAHVSGKKKWMKRNVGRGTAKMSRDGYFVKILKKLEA